jgi:hypothetical protein
MKKIMLTTALVGSLVSAASAQTTVSGNLAIGYYATSKDNSNAQTSTAKSYNRFANESQINFASKGKLNNGMDYAAGFSWESDGAETLANLNGTLKGTTEGTYIEIISGSTTIGLSADRAGTIDGLGVNFAGFGYRPISGATTDASIVGTSYLTPGADFGFNVRQNVGVGEISAVYVPNTGLKSSADIGNDASKNTLDGGESAYEITYTGKLGPIDAKIGGNRTNGKAGFHDAKAEGIQLAYTMGASKVGVSRARSKASIASSSAQVKLTTTEVGVAHNISNNLSAGLTYTKGETTTAAKQDEKIITAAVGYNLGAVSVQAQYKDASDIGGTSGADAQQFGLYVATKF